MQRRKDAAVSQSDEQSFFLDTIAETSGPVMRPALRRDRILDEAKHTADPVHLMTVFGISAKPP